MKCKKLINLSLSFIFFFSLLNISSCKKTKKVEVQKKFESTSRIPENTFETVSYIVKTLKQGKKYIAKENLSLFKKIVLAKWRSFVWGECEIEIKEKGIFIREYYDHSYLKNVKEYGRWKLDNNILIFNKKDETKAVHIEIEYFLLTQLPENDILKRGVTKYNYTFKIVFTKETQQKENLYEFYMQF